MSNIFRPIRAVQHCANTDAHSVHVFVGEEKNGVGRLYSEWKTCRGIVVEEDEQCLNTKSVNVSRPSRTPGIFTSP